MLECDDTDDADGAIDACVGFDLKSVTGLAARRMVDDEVEDEGVPLGAAVLVNAVTLLARCVVAVGVPLVMLDLSRLRERFRAEEVSTLEYELALL